MGQKEKSTRFSSDPQTVSEESEFVYFELPGSEVTDQELSVSTTANTATSTVPEPSANSVPFVTHLKLVTPQNIMDIEKNIVDHKKRFDCVKEECSIPALVTNPLTL